MSYNTQATFYPGGDDSYYMPEVIAPAPQRIGEQPSNIQQNVAHMEQQAQGVRQFSSSNTQLSPPNWSQISQPNDEMFTHQPQNKQRRPSNPSKPLPETPNFSPFPPLRNHPPNVPPTDEQKEVTLEGAREAVLSSNDPEVQLIWAQDALTYVEISEQNEQRISATQPARSRTPRLEHALKEDALKVVNFLADQHHPKAEFMRGMWLEFGKLGHRIDKKEAFMCYTRSAERGYERAEYRIGMQFESSNDALKAIKYYQRGAEAGDSAACYRLGMMTLLGQHGQVQDYRRGLDLIQQSAQKADENAPQGAYVYGMLQAGQLPQISIPEVYLSKDLVRAKINIEKSAFLGFAKAQVKMGSAYELCDLGCPFDPLLSLHYNNLAARQGEPEAEMAISKWFLCGHEGLFDKNEEMAFTYAQRAALSGLATAQFAIGYFYEIGIYVPTNYAEAKEWYRKASENGNKEAGGRISDISRSKTLSRKDHEIYGLAQIKRKRGSLKLAQTLQPLQEAEAPAALNMPDPSRLSLNDSYRPPSVAPYPSDQANAALSTGPDFRPSSAFGINPNLRVASAGSGTPRPDGYPSTYGSNSPQSRPQSGNAPTPQGYGRGGRLTPGQPPQRGGLASQGPSRLSSAPAGQQNQQGGPQPQKLDIGYSAPLNSYPPVRGDPSANNVRKPLPSGANPPRTSSLPQAPPSDAYRRQASGQRLPSVQPAKVEPSRVPSAAPTPPPPKPSVVSANAASARPPGKGPKTFEEMGVPQGKNDSECTVM